MQPNEKGTRKDLVLYRIETSKSDIKAAESFWQLKNSVEQITGHIMQSFMRLMQCMQSTARHTNDIKMLWRILTRII